MQLRNKKGKISALIVVSIFAISITTLFNPMQVYAGEGWTSTTDFEEQLGYIEFDSWGNFSANPTENPSPMKAMSASARMALLMTASYNLLSAGRCTSVLADYDSMSIIANFKWGSKMYQQTTVNGYGVITGKALSFQTEDEGGWALNDAIITPVNDHEKAQVEKGPSQAGVSQDTITFRDDGTANGMSFATAPTTNNYTMDSADAIYGVAYQAGGDKSLNELGQDIADASDVTFIAVLNSTLDFVMNHEDGEGALSLAYVTFDETSTDALSKAQSGLAGGASLGIIHRFVSRLRLKTTNVIGAIKNKASSTVYKGLTFIKKKASSVVSKVARTGINAMKAGISVVASPFKAMGKMALIGIVGIAAIGIILYRRR